MNTADDAFESLAQLEAPDDLHLLVDQPVPLPSPAPRVQPAAATAILHGFDLTGQPMLSGVAALPGEIVSASSTIALEKQHAGRKVVVLFEDGDARRPIVMGLVQTPAVAALRDQPAPVIVQADDERHEIAAAREIVLRCGDASITLTRAGKVIIKGAYVLTRSSGYNKVKGAVVEIN